MRGASFNFNETIAITPRRGMVGRIVSPMVDRVVGILLLFVLAFPLQAADLETIGDTRLLQADATLAGAGVTVAQAESLESTNGPDFEVNPGAVGQPISLFTWISTNGSSTAFPNNLGTESYHADGVGDFLYSPSRGIAPGVAHVDNYEADYFYDSIIVPGVPISDQVVNQSFAFGNTPPQQTVDSAYDDYIDLNTNVFCSAAGLGATVGAPGTAYNCIAVGAYSATAGSPVGPTLDNHRSKPDMVAPGVEESFALPYVSGAAAVLLQAAVRGDGGANTSAAKDLRTVKALLLNGALKPNDWTHSTNAPLDTRYGAGVLNIYYSYEQLAARQQRFTTSTSELAGSAHPPVSNAGNIASLLGWDFETIANPALDDVVNHYCFNISATMGTAYTLTATLVWDRAYAATGVNYLALYLYNATNSALVAASVSQVDNVQHLYAPHLPAGQYDLQVVKFESASASYTPSETYALAYQYFPIAPPPLTATPGEGNCIISWPSSPAIFILQQTSSLNPPVSWSNVSNPGWITNSVVAVTLPTTTNPSFYRLIR